MVANTTGIITMNTATTGTNVVYTFPVGVVNGLVT